MTLKNTDNDYIIEVINTQTIDGSSDVIEERARGKYYERGGRKYILYKTFSEGVINSSVIIAADGSVTIKRSGGAKSNMVLDVRRETSSPYYTPYGTLLISAVTDSIISSLGADGGELKLKYTLIIQGEKYHNNMVIKVIGDKR